MDECIFEKRTCGFAENNNGSFSCNCKSDDEMPCKNHYNRPSVSLYERNRSRVYATGNKWAIENWNATH